MKKGGDDNEKGSILGVDLNEKAVRSATMMRIKKSRKRWRQ